MPDRAEELLRTTFGFERFRPGQREVIDRLLDGASALAVFPTGAGKSLCYQLPALAFDGMTVVVSPLIALMKDQIDFLTGRGVAAARLDSSLTGEEARAVWQALREGTLRLLYVSPERFASERFVQRLRRLRIELLVVDEAHCISEWGHNFRPDYLKLARLARDLDVRRVLALTATATPAVSADIQRAFDIADEACVNTGFHRPNLTLHATPCAAADRDALLLDRLRARPPGATVVYVTLQKTAEAVAARLAAAGLDARAYHAGMADEDRHAVQDWFMRSAEGIVVATIAFGMGIDKADIRCVYHYNLPKSPENYMQEIGRAGRDGAPALCHLFVCPHDVVTLENFSYGDTPDDEAVGALVRDLLGRDDRFSISVYDLSVRFDIRRLVVATLLTYLELEGILAATGPFYDTYRFRPLRSSEEILADYDTGRARFLRRLFARAEPSKVWFRIDVTAAAHALEEPRGRIVAALNHLEEQGDFTLKVSGLRQGYRFAARPGDPERLVASLQERFRRAEETDIARVRRMVELGTGEACLVRRLLAHFDEDLGGDCGHCDRCAGEPVPPPPPPLREAPDEAERALIRELVGEGDGALRTPRQRARFLCGLASPATLRAKLTHDERFGALRHLPFAAVMDAARTDAAGARRGKP